MGFILFIGAIGFFVGGLPGFFGGVILAFVSPWLFYLSLLAITVVLEPRR